MNKTHIAIIAIASLTAAPQVRGAGPSGSTIYGYQTFSDEGQAGSFCEIDAQGTTNPKWFYSYASAGAVIGSAW
ncbi:MAG: hypothetical protein K2F79_09235, partial [Muribaculaceae bacterium]|nr:hypothetical protein [Muribaculaceae bacterium]